MNGKEYVTQAIELVGTLVTSIKDAGVLEGNEVIHGAEKACEELNSLKGKATLRTKEGTNLAFPVYDAAQNLEEAWEDAQGRDDVDDLKWRLEGFADAVMAFAGSLKDKTVIMT